MSTLKVDELLDLQIWDTMSSICFLTIIKVS